MRKVNTSVLLLLFMLTASLADAQSQRKGVQRKGEDKTEQVYKAYLDSLVALKQRYENWTYTGDDVLTNPYYYSLFASPTFYAASVHRVLPPLENNYRPRGAVDTTLVYVSDALNYVYTHAPWLIVHNETDIEAVPDIREKKPTHIKPDISMTRKTGNTVPEQDEDNLFDASAIVVRRPNFWTFKTTIDLKIKQNYTSENWYRGGESNNSWLAQVNFNADYNNKQKITWSNLLETKLGFHSLKNDQYHDFIADADVIRFTSKLGLKATKHWYYTVSWQSWTQFTRGFRSNNDHVYSDFMSPFETNLSIGMEYKQNVTGFNLTAAIQPFGYNMKYVDRKGLASANGIDAGKHSKSTYGSNITMRHEWNIAKNISWKSRLYYFTNYERVLVEWEHTFKFSINKYLSTDLSLYPRFDDSVKHEPGDCLLQMQEMLTFGLSLTL